VRPPNWDIPPLPGIASKDYIACTLPTGGTEIQMTTQLKDFEDIQEPDIREPDDEEYDEQEDEEQEDDEREDE
jgi:hypothetical protein